MDILTIKTQDLDSKFQVDGISLVPHFKDLDRFYGIPSTLHNVDRRFKTDTYLEVLRAATPAIKVIVDEDNTQVLNPKATFISDTEFEDSVESLEKNMGVAFTQHRQGLQISFTTTLQMTDDDNYLNDAFSRKWTIVRKPEGGVHASGAIERLACTNGMVLPEKQFNIVSHNSIPDLDALNKLNATVSLTKVSDYLKQMFAVDGEAIPCSMAEMLDMDDCLRRLVDSEEYISGYPIEGVTNFYKSQGIEVDKLSRKFLDKLPTGLSYYQALQILTHGAKKMTNPTIENQIKIAKFCTPKKMKNLKDVNLHWQGTPTWKTSDIHRWMGDH